MQRLFILAATPFLFDACVAACLDGGSNRALQPCPAEVAPGDVAFFDWDQGAGPGNNAALAMESVRRVHAELPRDGLTATHINLARRGITPGTPRRAELILRQPG